MSPSPIKHSRAKYKGIDELVFSYQEKASQDNAAKIIDQFEGLIGKFVNLICYGRIDVRNAGQITFAKCHTKREDVHSVKFTTCYNRPQLAQAMREVAHNLSEGYKMFEEDEIRDELIVVLLDMARKYTPTKGVGFFHLYIKKKFHYDAFNHLTKLRHFPPAGVKPQADLSINEDWALTLAEAPYTIGEPVNGELDDNWINGLTCSHYFEDLSPLERRILIWEYDDGLTEDDVAEKLSCHRITVNRRKKAAKLKLQQKGLVQCGRSKSRKQNRAGKRQSLCS